MNAIAASTSNQIATVSPQLCVYGMKYAPISANPTTAVMSSGTVRFIIGGRSGEHLLMRKSTNVLSPAEPVSVASVAAATPAMMPAATMSFPTSWPFRLPS